MMSDERTEQPATAAQVDRVVSHFDLPIDEWCDYWKRGNDTYLGDDRSCDPLTREDLALAADLVKRLLKRVEG